MLFALIAETCSLGFEILWWTNHWKDVWVWMGIFYGAAETGEWVSQWHFRDLLI